MRLRNRASGARARGPAFCGIVALGLALPPATGLGAPSGSFEECRRRVGREPAALDSYLCFRNVARGTGLWDEALSELESRVADDPGSPWARLGLAAAADDRGESGAEEHFRAAIAGFARRDEGAGEARARVGLAYLLTRRGELDAAREELQRAAARATGAADATLESRVHVAEAWLAQRRGEYSRAELILTRIEDDLFPDGPAELRALWLSTMGAVCWLTRRLPEARQAYERQIELLKQQGDRHSEATARSNLVFVTSAIQGPKVSTSASDKERLRDLAEAALAVAAAGGNRRTSAKMHLALGQLPGPTEERRRHLREGGAQARALGAIRDHLLALRMRSLSLIEEDPRDPDECLRLIEEALTAAREAGDPGEIVRSSIVRMSAQWTLAREYGRAQLEPSAIRFSLAALDAIESLRDRQSDAVTRSRTFAAWAFVYDRFVGHLLWTAGGPPSRESLELAYQVVERKRAQVLLSQIDTARVERAGRAHGPDTEKRTVLLGRIAALQRRLAGSRLTDAERARALQERERLEAEEAALRAAADANRSGESAASSGPPALAELEGALPADTALLSFHTSSAWPNLTFQPGSSLFVHTRTGTRAYRGLPDLTELEQAVELYVGLVLNRDGSEAAGSGRLFRDLLAPALSDLPPGVRRLVIVPDGPLHRLPFGTLRGEGRTSFLGERYALTLAPSATLWLRWRRLPSEPAVREGLAFVDPDLSALLEDPVDAPAPEAAAERDAVLAAIPTLGRLPQARREGRALRRFFGSGVRVLAGARATERALKDADLSRVGFLHFGAHALVDSRNPDRDAVVLAPGGWDEDGLLQAREVMELDLSGSAVVLSACRSASGALLEGEGLVSLARAFFVAGAHAVVGSLWPIRDAESAALFEHFYRHLGQGESLADALAAARRDAIRAGAPPAAWSGLVLYGDGDLVPRPPGPEPGWAWTWSVAVGLTLAVGLALAWAIGRRRPARP